MSLLDSSFFARDPLVVAQELLGHHLVHGPVTLRITETEAYRGGLDSASHTRRGRTARNAPMFGPPGHAYIYLCYGIHHMLNITCWPDGKDGGTLIRAAECVSGLDIVRARRGDKRGPVLLSGPGKVGAALGVHRSMSGTRLIDGGPLRVEWGEPVSTCLVGPRVGIDYSEPADRDAPWRFAMPDTRWVSVRKTLRPASDTATAPLSTPS